MELDMTKGNPFSLIGKFIVPLIIGNIFQQLYNMVDTIIVGQAVGVCALAAVGATGTIMFLILGFMQGLTAGFTVITAQKFGAKDYTAVRKSVGNATILSVIVTVLATSISILGMNKLLQMMHTPDDIFNLSYEYITIICLGMGCNILYNLLSSILRAVGNSKVPLYFLVLSAVLNVILDLIMIVNWKMGVAGAAWATVIAQGISGILCIVYIVKKVPLLHVRKQDFRLDLNYAKNQMGIGIPMALQFSITAVGTILVQGALNMLGSTVVAAYTAAGKVQQLFMQPFLAMGMTMTTYSAQNRGINDIMRIKKGVKAANIMSGIYGIIISIVAVIIMPYAVSLFINGNIGDIVNYANIYTRTVSPFFVPLGIIFIYRNTLQGCGCSMLPMLGGVVELVSRGIIAILAAEHKSYVGVCAADAAAWLSAGVFLLFSYIIVMRKWKRKGLY